MTISSSPCSPYREAAEKPWAQLKKRHRRLLDLMADGSWHQGRDLKRHLGWWAAGSIYVHLHELERMNWIESELDHLATITFMSGTRFTRRRYRLKLESGR